MEDLKEPLLPPLPEKPFVARCFPYVMDTLLFLVIVARLVLFWCERKGEDLFAAWGNFCLLWMFHTKDSELQWALLTAGTICICFAYYMP